MPKLKNVILTDLPELSPPQVEAVVIVLDAIVETIWIHYGERFIAAMPPIKPAQQSKPLDDSDLDLPF